LNDIIRTFLRLVWLARWDVVHGFFADYTGWCAAIAGWVLQVPLVASLAGGEVVALRDIRYGDQLRLHQRLLLNWVARRASQITAGSRYMLDQARQYLPRAVHAKLVWAPLGVDMARFSPREANAQTSRLLQVSSTHPVKDNSLLLRIFQHVARTSPEAALEVVGRGWSEMHLESYPLRSRVFASGEIPHDRLPKVYQRASLYLQTSRHEAQGMAVLEAAASGLPIVGTPVGILRELAPNAAQLAKNETELATAANELLKNNDMAIHLGNAARERVCQDYSIEKCLARFEALYSKQ
jgi:glycosyltransferase involved in cell wall biosynthesis